MKIIALASLGAALTASVATWWVTHDVLTAKHKAEVLELRDSATVAFNKAVAASLEIERANYANAQKLELVNAQHRKTLDATLAENRRLSRELGGLRDPYAITSSCPVPTSSSGSGLATPTTASGRLSDQAQEFLFAFARDADEAASYAMTCREWVKAIQK